MKSYILQKGRLKWSKACFTSHQYSFLRDVGGGGDRMEFLGRTNHRRYYAHCKMKFNFLTAVEFSFFFFLLWAHHKRRKFKSHVLKSLKLIINIFAKFEQTLFFIEFKQFKSLKLIFIISEDIVSSTFGQSNFRALWSATSQEGIDELP